MYLIFATYNIHTFGQKSNNYKQKKIIIEILIAIIQLFSAKSNEVEIESYDS
jgi:hypothetical protein